MAAVGTLIVGAVLPAAASDPGTWTPTDPPTGSTWVVLESGPGDYVGQGATHAYTPQDAVITVTDLSSTPGTGFRVTVEGDESWTGSFEVPEGTAVDERLYDGATRFPFNAPDEPGLSWTGEGRGCNAVTGWFVIDGFSYGTDGSVEFLALRFEQWCDASADPLHGAVRYDAGAPPPDPLNPRPIPSGLWEPDPALLPPGSEPLVVLESEPGEYIGQGQTYVHEGPSVSWRTTGNRAEIDVSTPTTWWYGDFAPPDAAPRLEVGLYDDLQRHPFHNPVLGGLSWSGNGRGCNELTGWFIVDEVSYTPNGLVGLSLRFEQHCDASSAPLRGLIEFGVDRTPPDTTPPSITSLTGPEDRTRSTTAMFTFTASEPATFTCSLDGAPATACTSPTTESGLSGGSHTFTVVATDLAGNVSQPATWSWSIKGGKGKPRR